MPTIKDVAARAGVSIKTVSRVINQDPAVRPATRALVEQAIVALDYAPDPIAQSLRRGRTGTIGIVTDVVVTTPWSVELVRGIQDTCADMGLLPLILTTREQPDHEQRLIRLLLERKVDGILYLTGRHRRLAKPPEANGLPLMLVNCSARDSDLPAIVPDDFQGGYTAARYLIDLGHRDLALVSLIPEFEATRLRGEGFQQALADHCLTCEPPWQQVGEISTPQGDVYTTREATLALLAGPRRPTAIVCGKDEIAMRVYNTVRAQGLRIPEDISIIGYDNIEMLAEGLDPTLTTIALPYYRMGQEAVVALHRLIQGETPAERLRKIPCPLVERASCRSPASH